MTYIWIGLIVGILVCYFVQSKIKVDLSLLCFVLFIVLMFSLVGFLVTYYTVTPWIEEYHALQDTVDVARETDEIDLERAAIMTKVAEMNMELKKHQYWAQTIFNVYYPSKIMELEPIR